jgi:hypothetical protein
VFQLVDCRLDVCGGFDGGHLLDLRGKALDFLLLAKAPRFGLLAVRFVDPME